MEASKRHLLAVDNAHPVGSSSGVTAILPASELEHDIRCLASRSTVINQPLSHVFRHVAVSGSRPLGRGKAHEACQVDADTATTDPALRCLATVAGRAVEYRYVFYEVPGGTQVAARALAGNHALDTLVSPMASAIAARRLDTDLRQLRIELE